MSEETLDQNENEYNFLVYQFDTWGSFGQHIKVFKFLVDVENKFQKPLWEIAKVKWENSDSNKNKHRKAYASLKDILAIKGKILKVVNDYQNSKRREISVKYYYISSELQEIQAETGVKVNNKYYDILQLNDKKIMVSKDEVVIQ